MYTPSVTGQSTGGQVNGFVAQEGVVIDVKRELAIGVSPGDPRWPSQECDDAFVELVRRCKYSAAGF